MCQTTAVQLDCIPNSKVLILKQVIAVCCMPCILVLGRQRQSDVCELKSSLVYIVSSKTARTTQRGPVSEVRTNKQTTTKQSHTTLFGPQLLYQQNGRLLFLQLPNTNAEKRSFASQYYTYKVRACIYGGTHLLSCGLGNLEVEAEDLNFEASLQDKFSANLSCIMRPCSKAGKQTNRKLLIEELNSMFWFFEIMFHCVPRLPFYSASFSLSTGMSSPREANSLIWSVSSSSLSFLFLLFFLLPLQKITFQGAYDVAQQVKTLDFQA